MSNEPYVMNQQNSGVTAVASGDIERPSNDVQRSVWAMVNKATGYNSLWNFYDGEHPQIYTNKKLAEIFRDIDVRFNENWCAVVVDAVLDRVQLLGAQVEPTLYRGKPTKKSRRNNENLTDLWRGLGLDAEADEAHLDASVFGEGFVICWPGEDGQPDVYHNDARMVHLFYEPSAPRTKRMAAKLWYDDWKDRMFLTLYYRDRLEYYAAAEAGNQIQYNSAFVPMETAVAKNPFNTVPVFHFRSSRRQKSDLKNAVPVQIAINKLVNDLMVSAEYAAFKQRWIISQSDVLDNLTNAPNEIWQIPGGDGMGQDTAVGSFSETALSNYIGGIDHFASALSSITKTPKHFLFQARTNVSGEALRAMEAPLTGKAKKRVDRFTPEWRDMLSFLMRLSGARVPSSDIQLSWGSAQAEQPLHAAEVRETNKRAGIPIKTQLRKEGWTQDELQQMDSDLAESAA